ncbi:MAG: imidazole glycerol phosphate synthase subunit HisH [bacterium]|nr:imidazole glycerol phosphate synthase subunit HisH [bacterium]
MSAANEDPVVVIDYGMGNIHSIVKALRLYASNVVFTDDPAQIARARALVLPGDGAFPAAMQNLSGPLENGIREYLAAGGRMLGVCIGFQILFEDSDESVGPVLAGDAGGARTITRGLGLIPGRIRRFHFPLSATPEGGAQVRIPHMGWNRLLHPRSGEPGDHMYFIHSYRAEGVPDEYVVARCEYAGDVFPAVVRNQSGTILAAQFHPEKSDRVGLKFLEDWVASL